jgi:hypothetical protein
VYDSSATKRLQLGFSNAPDDSGEDPDSWGGRQVSGVIVAIPPTDAIGTVTDLAHARWDSGNATDHV